MKAMILAAGKGTRLLPLTLATPKPLAPIAGAPLLLRTIALLRGQGISEVLVNVHHQAGAIRSALGDGAKLGVALRFSEEPELLGTAGGVGKVREFFDSTFAVLYGDNYYRFDLAPLLARHREAGALATLATFTTPHPTACGLVETDREGKVVRFVEKPPAHEVFTDQANAGVYILEPEILACIPESGECDFGRDVFPALLRDRPGCLASLPLDGYIEDTGTPEKYRQANWDAVALHGQPAAAATARIERDAILSGRNVIGARCRIESGASLEESILWDDVTLGPGASVRGAILGHGVSIGAGAVVGEGCLLADGSCVLDGATLPPGTTLGPNEIVTK